MRAAPAPAVAVAVIESDEPRVTVAEGADKDTIGTAGAVTVSVWLLLVAVDPKLSVATAVKV